MHRSRFRDWADWLSSRGDLRIYGSSRMGAIVEILGTVSRTENFSRIVRPESYADLSRCRIYVLHICVNHYANQ
jgi:hypothetical protein